MLIAEFNSFDNAGKIQLLSEIKRKIVLNKNVKPLFNSREFTEDIERLYTEMMHRKINRISSNHITSL